MATVDDMPAVMELVTELAIFEKAADQVTNTVEQLTADGFGEHPLFETVLAEDDGIIVGMSLYYFCLLYTSPSPRDGLLSRMPSSA